MLIQLNWKIYTNWYFIDTLRDDPILMLIYDDFNSKFKKIESEILCLIVKKLSVSTSSH